SNCDAEKAVDGVVKSITQNAGQTCSAGSRLLIESSFKATFIEQVINRFKQLTIGSGLTDKDIGPILNEKQYKRVQSYIQLAQTEGEVLLGGKACMKEGSEKGFYIEPNIVD